jgi:nucleoside-diphosphate-sugar epimerase
MEKEILVAGSTGDLGGRIVKALLKNGARVRALVRSGADPVVVDLLRSSGVNIVEADLADREALIAACTGVSCVVSALAGLRDVIVDTQSLLLEAAVNAGVPRFIPSDYSTDFTLLPEGTNRNFDLRKEFMRKVDGTNIKATSIFNGAFAELLTYNIPFLGHKNKTVAYWEKPDWKVDFTSMNDTAAFTAKAALDDDSPRYLRIASFQVSAREMAEASGYELKYKGTLAELDAYNKSERAAHPEGENELYAKWQQSQYMHSMFSAQNQVLDNERYPGLVWSTLPEYLR